MSFEFNIEDFNENLKNKFKHQVSEPNYMSLEDYYNWDNDKDKVFVVKSVWINEQSKFGAHPCFATENDLVLDIPAHKTEQVRVLLDNDDFVKHVNDGKVGIRVNKYYSNKYKKECYSFTWTGL